jgi:hypothetical protein
MNVFGWLDASQAKAFGTELAQFFIQQLPLDANVSEKKFSAKSQHVLKKMGVRVVEFKKLNKLNTYKTAQLGNAFRWALKDAGYDQAYVETLTKWLVTRL